MIVFAFKLIWLGTYVFYWLIFFLSFIFMFLQILFFTTCERKILALTQRRLGPTVVGDRGRLQFLADALKLLFKNSISPKYINSTLFQASALGVFWMSWWNFCNLHFGPGEDIMEIEYNLFYMVCVSLIFSLAWLLSGWSSISKYALLGCIRSSIQIISYEILMSIIFLNIFLFTGTTNFEILTDIQETYPLFLVCPIIGCICFIAVMMETNRPPFDLSETESDVVAGYMTEYSGILFGLFYLGEYINLFTNGFILSLIFFGGWWNCFYYFDYFINIIINFLDLSIFNNQIYIDTYTELKKC